MKYLVIETINTNIDACLHHESCIGTCSDGSDAWGTPWIFVRSGLLDNYEEAKELVDKLYYERFKELNEDVAEDRGWFIATTKDLDESKVQIICTSTALFVSKTEEDLSEDEWLYMFDILEIDA